MGESDFNKLVWHLGMLSDELSAAVRSGDQRLIGDRNASLTSFVAGLRIARGMMTAEALLNELVEEVAESRALQEARDGNG